LLGLAVLAAAGALFDYWPVSNDMPMVARLPRPVSAPAIALPTPAELAAASAVTKPVMARRAVRPVPDWTVPSAPAATPVQPAPVVSSIVVSNAPFHSTVGRPVAFAPVPVWTPAAPTLAAATVVELRDPIEVEMIPMVAPARGEDDGSAVGFVTGALKKTGQTIRRTGAAAGGSIRDALVSFGGAFRKIL
jgi:hypothetical protein